MTPNDPTSPDAPNDDPVVVRTLRELLVLELQRPVPSDEGEVMQSQLIERRLVRMAMDGNLAAIREIHDRTDGKASSAPRPQRPQRVIMSWDDRLVEESHAADA